MIAHRWPFLALTFLALLAAPALAGTVDMKFLGIPLYQEFNYSVASLSVSQTTPAGIEEWQRVGGTENGPPFDVFRSVCLEVNQFVADDTYTVLPVQASPTPGPAMGPEKAALLAKLWAAHWDQANQGAVAAAAFQAAVWEVVYDTGDDILTGNFHGNYPNLAGAPMFVQLAQTWLSGLSGLTSQAELVALSNPKDQDQLVMVPLPPAVVAGGLLIAGLALRAHQRRRQNLM